MFTLKIKNCRRFTTYQDSLCFDYLIKFSKLVNISGVEFWWNMDMNSHNGVIGCFHSKYPKSIFVMPYPHLTNKDTMICDGHIKRIIPTIVHKLTHKAQYDRMGCIKYTLYAIPFLREALLEKEARANERLAEIEMDSINLNIG